MKKYLKSLLTTSLMLLTVSACGGSENNDSEEPVPVAAAPKVVTTTPANGATDVNPAGLTVEISFDQQGLKRDKSISLTVKGGDAELSGSESFDGTKLSLPIKVTTYNTAITISLPEGYVFTTGAKSEAYSLTFTTMQEPAPEPADGHEAAAEAVKKMIAGWNLGNTLDAWSNDIPAGSPTNKYETCWGQPIAEEFLMKKFKEKGFTAIRIPVTWFQKMDAADQVSQAWMDRVETVVKYVLNNGMYCILNVHHDTGAGKQAWLKVDETTYAQSNARFKKLWTQIANRFKDYDKQLLFEGYNEMLTGSDGEGSGAQWNQPQNLNNLTIINKYAQDFVDAVRATGGNNQYRNLIVTTYSASHGQQVLGRFVVPTDPCGNQKHLAIEVHSYDPWDWVNTYKMKWTSQCTNEITNMFKDLNTYFISKGYPVIVGEYGSNGNNEKTINKNSSDAEKAEAAKQASDMTRLCKQYGAAAFYWMGIVDGNDRKESSFKWSMEAVADAIVNASK